MCASPTHRMVRVTEPPGGVNLRLLDTKLMTTWRMRCWSPYRIMSFNLPRPKGPRSPTSFGRPFPSRLFSYVPSYLTASLMPPSLACFSKIARICWLMSLRRNSFSSRLSCCPTWFLLRFVSLLLVVNMADADLPECQQICQQIKQ
jgi:hypothetical protein